MPETVVYIILFSVPLLSGIILWFTKPEKTNYLHLLLSFSGAFLLTICIVHLLPELYKSHSNKVGLFILLGFLLQLILEYFSKGIEHGHMHIHSSFATFPFAIYTSLCIHSMVEGMALTNPNIGGVHSVYISSYQNALLIGILLHKIPVTLVLVTLLVAARLKRSVQVLSLVIFCLCSPVGLYLANILGGDAASSLFNFNVFLAISIGIFLHISTTILFESSKNHKFNFINFLVLLSGIAIAYLTTI